MNKKLIEDMKIIKNTFSFQLKIFRENNQIIHNNHNNNSNRPFKTNFKY